MIEFERDIGYVLDAHRNHPRKQSMAYRKWDGKTPYGIHPIWCATTIATETSLDENTRGNGILTLLYHDVLEDTTQPLPEWLPEEIRALVSEMTFEGGSTQEMAEIWGKPNQIRLYKLYDKVSNLLDGSWMSEEKRNVYKEYTKRLASDIEGSYGSLNIIKIAYSVLLNEGHLTKERRMVLDVFGLGDDL